jgi:predicted N-acetyltransferase YhbS
MNVTLRKGSPADAEICGRICYEAFKTIAERHNFPPDFPDVSVAIDFLSYLLSRKDLTSVLAEMDGRIVGSNFLWGNADIAGIGPITVASTQQNSTVGRQLMEHVIERSQAAGFAGIRLVQAAYNNRSMSLYTKLGFHAREPLSTLQGPALGITLAGYAVRSANENDVKSCNQLCAQVHGYERGSELLEAVKQQTATVVERGGRITGYATVVGFFGHAVSETSDDLKALIGAAPSFPGPGLLLPTRNYEVFRWCLDHGLRVIQPMTLMSIGAYQDPAGAFLPSVLY